MGNYENLKQSITEVIRTNGNKEITGAVLQSTLLTIISTVGANATFAGIATPTTNPGTPDGPVFYLASESGTYSNFGSIELQDGLSVLMWNGSWSSQQILGVDDEPTAGSDNLVKSGGVKSNLDTLGAKTGVVDVTLENGFLDESGTITAQSAFPMYVSDKIPCAEGDQFFFKAIGYYGTSCVAVIFSGDTVSRFIKHNGDKSVYEQVNVVTIEEGETAIRFGSRQSYPPKFFISDVYPLYERTKELEETSGFLTEQADYTNYLSWVESKFWTGTVGSVISTNPYSSLKYANLIRCKKGDKFIIATRGHDDGKSYYVLDKSKVVLYASDASEVTGTLEITQDNAYYLAVNVLKSYTNFKLQSCTQNTLLIQELQQDLQDNVQQINEDIQEINDAITDFVTTEEVGIYYEIAPFEILDNKLIADNGDIVTFTGPSFKVYKHNLSNITNGKVYLTLTGWGAVTPDNPNFLIYAFYKQDGTFISGSTNVGKTVSEFDKKRIVIPTDAAMIYTLRQSKVYKIDTQPEDLTPIKNDIALSKFEIEQVVNRCWKLENINPFEWKGFDRAKIVFTIDDANANMPMFYDLFHAMNLPLSPAVPPSTLDTSYTTGYDYANNEIVTVSSRTVLSLLNSIVSDGGEILSHEGKVLGTLSPVSTYETIFRDSKRKLEEKGFVIRGLIAPGGTPSEGEGTAYYAQGTSKYVDWWVRRYYDYCDLYGLLGDEAFHHTRFYLWHYPVANYPDPTAVIADIISRLQTKIANKELIIFGAHGSTTANSIENVKNVRALLEAIATNFMQGVDYDFTVWSDVYDNFASTKILNALDL